MRTPIGEIKRCPYGHFCGTCANAKHIVSADACGFDTFCTIYSGKESETQAKKKGEAK